MKKILILFLTIGTLMSCLSDNDDPNYDIILLPINSYTVPDEFNFGAKETVKVKFTLPDGCHAYHSVYYQYDGDARIIAVRAIKYKEDGCTDSLTEKEVDIDIQIRQREDYILKFWKGKNDDDEDVFDEVTIPVVI